jgi:hypothetical protein
MRSLPDLSKTVSSIDREVPFHLLVRVKPKFIHAKLDSSLIREFEQSSPIPLSLCIPLHRNAVNKDMIGILFQDEDPGRFAFSL